MPMEAKSKAKCLFFMHHSLAIAIVFLQSLDGAIQALQSLDGIDSSAFILTVVPSLHTP